MSSCIPKIIKTSRSALLMNKLLLIATISAATATVSWANTTVLFSDTFTTAARAGNGASITSVNSANSNAAVTWTNSNTPTGLFVSNTSGLGSGNVASITQTSTAKTFGGMRTGFTSTTLASPSYIYTLADGETITLSFSFKLDTSSPNYNSGTGEVATANNNVTVGFGLSGYAWAIGTGTGTSRVYEYATPGNTTFTTAVNNAGLALTDSNNHTFSLSVTRSGTSSIIRGTIDSTIVEHTDTTGEFDFNGISMVVNAANLGLFVDDVTVSVTSPVPEPSTYAALLGFAMLGFAGLRRRRRS